jgi:hypothetical protein
MKDASKTTNAPISANVPDRIQPGRRAVAIMSIDEANKMPQGNSKTVMIRVTARMAFAPGSQASTR